LRECVDERGSKRADAEGQSGSREEPAWAHLLAQDVQGDLENEVRDIEHTEDCVVVCEAVSVYSLSSGRSRGHTVACEFQVLLKAGKSGVACDESS
jgi:hypothetical protein